MKRINHFILWTAVLLIVVSCEKVIGPDNENESPINDSLALLAFNEALPEAQRFFWNDSLPLKNWRGIDLDSNNNVTGLFLYQLELSEIPAEIGLLKNLLKLNISSNNLTNLPSEMQKLTKLENLIANNKMLLKPARVGDLHYSYYLKFLKKSNQYRNL